MLNISKVEALIKEKGWSKKYFCDLFDHSRTWIDDWKRGVGVPKDNLLQDIADKLDTTVDYLTDKTEQKNKPLTEVRGYSDDAINVLNQIEQLSPANRAKLQELIRLFLADQGNKL